MDGEVALREALERGLSAIICQRSAHSNEHFLHALRGSRFVFAISEQEPVHAWNWRLETWTLKLLANSTYSGRTVDNLDALEQA